MTKRIAAALVLTVIATLAAYPPAPENLAARQWFREARFGLFIHWGVYSVPGRGEWVMHNEKIPISEYEKLAPRFNPVKFNPAEWVAMAKSAGMKYITITSKHHDGFAMFHTKQNKWNIVDATPYKKDVLKMLAEECRRQDVKLFFYHSQLDWHHPDYYPRGRTGQHAGRPERGDWRRYLDFQDAQLEELLTNYGPIAGIWFDGWWDRKDADWRLEKTYALIHRLRPAALIGNNHHVKPFEGEDFQMFEKDLPGHNTTGFSGDAVVSQLPLETCETINKAWGYNKNDHAYKSAEELTHYLVQAAGSDANFLLNVGPRPDGTIQPEFAERLRAIGQWLEKNGTSIYGTRGGPTPPRDEIVTTHKGSTVYAHILKPGGGETVELTGLGKKVASARLLSSRSEIPFEQRGETVQLTVPAAQRDPINTVVALETR
jgi:alpha-L-fucosidase